MNRAPESANPTSVPLAESLQRRIGTPGGHERLTSQWEGSTIRPHPEGSLEGIEGKRWTKSLFAAMLLAALLIMALDVEDRDLFVNHTVWVHVNRAFSPTSYVSHEGYPLIPNFIPSEAVAMETAIAIVTQLTVDRFDRLVTLSRIWNGSVSAVVYIDGEPHERAVRQQLIELVKAAVAHRGSLSKVDIHLVVGCADDSKQGPFSKLACPYPVNMLRNVAVLHARGAHVLNLDIDMLPNPDVYRQLHVVLDIVRKDPVHYRKTAFVLPCFEVDPPVTVLGQGDDEPHSSVGDIDPLLSGSSANLTVPLSTKRSIPLPLRKQELVALVRDERARQVHVTKGIVGNHAHAPTAYDRWLSWESSTHHTTPEGSLMSPNDSDLSSEASPLWYNIAYDWFFEPYYVVQRSPLLPLYDGRFAGYGNDKAAHALELAAAGFDFVVLTQPFVIHVDHPSAAWSQDLSSAHYGRVWTHWGRFVAEMLLRYPEFEAPDLPSPWLLEAAKVPEVPAFWEWELLRDHQSRLAPSQGGHPLS